MPGLGRPSGPIFRDDAWYHNQFDVKARCMAKLIYSMLTSLDGYTEDAQGHFGWGVPEDEEVHSYVNELASSLGTYLHWRRMYESMVYWETAHTNCRWPGNVC